MKSIRYAAALPVLFSVSFLLASCSGGTRRQAQVQRGVPVTVAVASQAAVPVQYTAIGHAEPYLSVTIKPQVSGQLVEVLFKEGQEVQKGDVLFRIDPQPYQEALNKDEAILAKDTALAAQAAEDEQKALTLFKKAVAPKEQYDQAHAAATADQNQVKADQAQVANDRLNLAYCTISSPLDGRTGSLMVDAGNIVTASTTQLVTINQLSPIFVSFTLPEQSLPDVKKYAALGSLKVQASVPSTAGQASDPPADGRLSFIDNQVDTASGTYLLKGTFTNRDRALWPGQFVNVSLTLTVQQKATVIPAVALQSGQNGQFVFVVKPDKTVESRAVTVERTVGNEVAIASGISPGETVVTDGQLLLVPGALVQVTGGGGVSAVQPGSGAGQVAARDRGTDGGGAQ